MDFLQVIKNAGLPTTVAELDVIWRAILADSGSKISNDNKMSPFWRIIAAVATAPVLWLIEFTASTVLPNLFVKTASREFLEILGEAVNVTPKLPSKTLGIITFTRADVNLAITIPANTIIQTATIAGIVYQVYTTEAKAFTTGSLTLTVPVSATRPGAAFNFSPNYFTVLPTPIMGITAVSNAENWIVSPGTDAETDSQLRDRIRNQFNLSSSYHTDSVYKGIISTFPGVSIDAIWFEHNAPRGPGTANAFVLFDFAATAELFLADINAYITEAGNHGHGDDLQVFQMPEELVNLSVDIWFKPFLSDAKKAELVTDITAFIRAAFRENVLYNPTLTLPFSRFSFSKLGAEIHGTFSDLHSIDFNADDIVSDLFIPRIDSLTLTQHEAE